MGLGADSNRKPDPPDDIYTSVYSILRNRARLLMSSETVGHTLQPTALVHEAYLKLADEDHDRWNNRAHFLAVASRAMRRILIDHARSRSRHKRGRGWDRVTLHDDTALPTPGNSIDLLDMIQFDRALGELEQQHERMGRVAEMRLFGGMAIEEISVILEVSKRTVEGDLAFARRWLGAAMADENRPDTS